MSTQVTYDRGESPAVRNAKHNEVARQAHGNANDLGYFATLAALQAAHATASVGNYAAVGATGTYYAWRLDGATDSWQNTGDAFPDAAQKFNKVSKSANFTIQKSDLPNVLYVITASCTVEIDDVDFEDGDIVNFLIVDKSTTTLTVDTATNTQTINLPDDVDFYPRSSWSIISLLWWDTDEWVAFGDLLDNPA